MNIQTKNAGPIGKFPTDVNWCLTSLPVDECFTESKKLAVDLPKKVLGFKKKK